MHRSYHHLLDTELDQQVNLNGRVWKADFGCVDQESTLN